MQMSFDKILFGKKLSMVKIAVLENFIMRDLKGEISIDIDSGPR